MKLEDFEVDDQGNFFGLRERNKKIFWTVIKPCCRECGYDKYIDVLHFHHLDKNQKKTFQGSLGSWLFKSTYEFLRRVSQTKFTILCANCHIEHHVHMRTGTYKVYLPESTVQFQDLFAEYDNARLAMGFETEEELERLDAEERAKF